MIAGSAESARRSRTKRRNSVGSDSACSIRERPSSAFFSPASLGRGAAATQFDQEFFWWHIVRILSHDSTEDNLRMSAQNVHHDRGAKLRQVVGADNHIVVFRQYGIQPR